MTLIGSTSLMGGSTCGFTVVYNFSEVVLHLKVVVHMKKSERSKELLEVRKIITKRYFFQ